MKKLYELIKDIKINDIEEYVALKNKNDITSEWAEDEINDKNNSKISYLKEAINNLKQIEPELNDNIITCFIDKDIDFEFPNGDLTKEIYYFQNISYINIDEIKRNPSIYFQDMFQAIDIGHTFYSLLGCYVYIEDSDKFTFKNNLLAIIDEICFLANNEKDLEIKNDEIYLNFQKRKKEIEEIDFNKVEEDKKFYTIDEMLEELTAGLDDDVRKEIFQEKEYMDKYQNEMSNDIRDVYHFNYLKNSEYIFGMLKELNINIDNPIKLFSYKD